MDYKVIILLLIYDISYNAHFQNSMIKIRIQIIYKFKIPHSLKKEK